MINFGDVGEKFYITLRGSLTVWEAVSTKEMIKPIERLKLAVQTCFNSNIEMSDTKFDFKFYLDPFIELDEVKTHYATFEDYNSLLDPYMNIADRRYLWYMYQLQRAIDVVSKLE